MKFKLSAIAAGILLMILSCNEGGYSTNAKDESATQFAPPGIGNSYMPEDSTFQVSQNVDQSPTGTQQATPNEDWNKKIIRNGTITLEVKDYSKYYQLIGEIVKREGGYIAQEDQQHSEYKLENKIVLKVPVARFEETMTLVSNGTGNDEVKEKKITSEDVTGEVVDTKSRIEAKKEVRLRYLDLLKQAKNMNDILQVQTEINEIQEQMEMASGRVNYLNHASAFSTITLTFYQILNPGASDQKEPSFSTKILDAFLSGWQFIKALIVGLVSIWPMFFLMFGLWLAFRRWKLSRPKST